jgi:hypothetical protein
MTQDILDDPNHWRVDLRGRVSGEDTLRSYHLAAESQGEARGGALRRWAGEFDEPPFIVKVERYRSWRAWESQTEGPIGAKAAI